MLKWINLRRRIVVIKNRVPFFFPSRYLYLQVLGRIEILLGLWVNDPEAKKKPTTTFFELLIFLSYKEGLLLRLRVFICKHWNNIRCCKWNNCNEEYTRSERTKICVKFFLLLVPECDRQCIYVYFAEIPFYALHDWYSLLTEEIWVTEWVDFH